MRRCQKEDEAYRFCDRRPISVVGLKASAQHLLGEQAAKTVGDDGDGAFAEAKAGQMLEDRLGALIE